MKIVPELHTSMIFVYAYALSQQIMEYDLRLRVCSSSTDNGVDRQRRPVALFAAEVLKVDHRHLIILFVLVTIFGDQTGIA